MKWTREHATYLENQIKRLDREYQDTDSDVVKEVVLRCKGALINLRRPTDN